MTERVQATEILHEAVVFKPVFENPDALTADGVYQPFNSDPAIYTTGAGKGGGGGGAKEAENTMRSVAVVRVVEVISEGPIEGLAGGAQGVYINDAPFQNQDLTYNFPGSAIDITRVGAPNEGYLPGFPAVESETAVGGSGTPVTILSNNISFTTQDTTNTVIDRVLVTIALPNGLSEQNTSNGDLNGTSVQFRIDRTLASPQNWAVVGTYTITGKTTSVYEAQYEIPRPAGTGPWMVRVVRITADPQAHQKTQTTFARVTQVQDIKIEYSNAAVIGIELDAKPFGNQIPKRGYLVRGVLVQIPNNLNPDLRIYSGIWNGGFKNTTKAFDNPAWIVYDVLTNTRYGAGIAPADIDKYSFYAAGQYCDQSVGYTKDGLSKVQPRFTFNVRIADRPQMLELVRNMCGAFNATLIYWNGKWTLIQDRPTPVSKIITKANTLAAKGFKYKSTPLYERHTGFNVTFNDTNDRYLHRTVTVPDPNDPLLMELVDRYEDYNDIDIPAYGCTNEAQAIRVARYALYTELNQTELCEFEMSLNGFDLMPGEVVSIYDEDTANNVGAGRVVAVGAALVGGRAITLDRACPITAGSKIFVQLANGRTIGRLVSGAVVGFDIVETSGNLSVVTISASTPVPTVQAIDENGGTATFTNPILVGADYIISSTIAPREFKVIDITLPEQNIVKVQALEHHSGKYSWVETGVDVPDPVFTNVVRTVVGPPSGLTFAEESVLLPTGASERRLRFTWYPPANQTVAGYDITWSRSSGNRVSFSVETNVATIPANEDGTYAVSVFSRDYNGNISGTGAEGSYTFTSGGATLTPNTFGAVINLKAKDSNGLTWNQDDLIVTWADNTTNTVRAIDYKVEVLTGATILRTEVVTEKEYVYDISKNIADGGPRGVITIRVTARDTSSRYAVATSVTFTNPAPGQVGGITVGASFQGAVLKWAVNPDPDVSGYYVWRGTTPAFATSSANKVFGGLATMFSDTGLSDSTTYYYKFAAYDRFNRNDTGAGLNVSGSTAVTTLAGVSINEFKVSGVTWTPNSPAINQVAWSANTVFKTMGVGAGTAQYAIAAGNATWTSGVLYIYYTEGENIFRSTTTITAAIADTKIIVATYRGGTNLEIGDGRAYQDGSLIIAGTVGAAQLVTGTAVITQGIQIGDSTITNNHFNIGSINASGGIRGLNFSGGALTSYAWPAANSGPGFFLGNSGLLMGNANDGRFFQLTNGGDVHSTNFSIIGGNVRITGDISGSSGTFVGNVSGGQFMTGGFVGFGWPAGGQGGSYLSGNGLLLGNASTGSYFQVNGDGSIYSPSFDVVGGVFNAKFQLTAANIDTKNLTIKDGSGAVVFSATAGLHGSYIQNLSVSTLKIAGNAITVPVFVRSNGEVGVPLNTWQTILTTAGQPINVGDGSVMITVTIDPKWGTTYDDINSTQTTFYHYYRVVRNGVTIADGEWMPGLVTYPLKDNPGPQDVTYELQHRYLNGSPPNATTTPYIPPTTRMRAMSILGVKK